MHDKTLFYEQKRDTDTILAYFEKSEFIPSFVLICKDAERLVHPIIVQEMLSLDYLNHDQDFQNLIFSLSQCVSFSF